jgi:hypothetical protein
MPTEKDPVDAVLDELYRATRHADQSVSDAISATVDRSTLLEKNGVALIVGSGNLVHNPQAYAWERHAPHRFPVA